MDSYRQKRYGWNFFLPLSVGVCLSIFFTQLVHEEFFRTRSEGIGPPIATVISSESQSFRKPNRRFQWEGLTAGSKLFRKDALRVGEKGFVRFRYDDGKEIELEPNSYVVLNDASAFGADFIEGNAILRDENGERQLEAKPGADPIEVSLTASLVSPESSKVFVVKEATPYPIEFQWKLSEASSGAPPVELQVAPNRQFTDKATLKFSAIANSIKKEFPPGSYFWRLVSDGVAVSVVREFSITKISPSAPLFPESNVSALKSNPVLHFRWSNPDDMSALGGTHVLQIAKTADFSPPEKEIAIAIESEGALVSDLSEGTLFWRIRSRYGELELASPSKKFVYELRSERILTQLGGEVAPNSEGSLEKGIELRWKADDEVETYEIEVRSSLDGKIIAKFSAPSPEANFTPPAPGRYEWRVVGQKANKKVAESGWKRLVAPGNAKVVLTAPSSGSLLLHGTKPKDFFLEWDGKSLPADAQFEIILGRDAEFRLPYQSEKTADHKLAGQSFKLSDDTYFWKVIAYDKDGLALGQSEVAQFRYAEAPPLPPPAPLELTQGTVWDVLKTKKAPIASWAKIDGAQKYELVVRRGETTVYRSLTENTSFNLKHLGDGEFVWSVRAIDEEGRLGDPTEPSVVKVIYPKLPAPKGLRLRRAKSRTKKT